MIEPLARGSTLTGPAWVIDGDTVAIRRIKIRLAGIDAPELDMPFGKKSKWAMVDLCRGQTLHVVLHGETSHDRQVGTAYLPDGRDVGAELIRRGLALDCAFYSGGKYRPLEPEGARRRLGNGAFGHRGIRRPALRDTETLR
jgi:endonuclease YncB( thermonuclease family)